jgi:hypothetical protein
VEAGALKDYKVLLLPETLAMTAQTAAAIADFVRGGGTLIADTPPAGHDYYLNPAPNGSPLAEMLGPPGEVRSAGNGRTLVMKEGISEYGYERFREKGPAIRAQVAGIMGSTGLVPVVTVAPDAEGKPRHPGLEIVTFQRGNGLVVGFLNHSAAPYERRVATQTARHVHDLRARKCRGLRKEWDLKIGSGECKLYALLPEQVAQINPVVPKAATRGSEALISLSDKALSGHIIAVAVTDPAGGERPEYASCVAVDGQGRAQTTMPFALNDPVGEWHIKIRDIAGGVAIDKALSLR